MPFILFSLFLALSCITGWVNNIIWTFHQTDFIGLAIGIIGIFAAPIGVIHGLYLFF